MDMRIDTLGQFASTNLLVMLAITLLIPIAVGEIVNGCVSRLSRRSGAPHRHGLLIWGISTLTTAYLLVSVADGWLVPTRSSQSAQSSGLLMAALPGPAGAWRADDRRRIDVPATRTDRAANVHGSSEPDTADHRITDRRPTDS